MVKFLLFFTLLLLAGAILPGLSIAGPPFVTDDPEPVNVHHWELYLAASGEFQKSGADGTLPQLEFNYGPRRNVQLHIVIPLGFMRTDSLTQYGYADTEAGLKFRFVQETESRPQVGLFPLVEVPTGNEEKGLGNGTAQLFLPVWLQKSWGRNTTYGGGGYWFNPGAGNTDWVYVGWELQRDFSRWLTLGGEIYYRSADIQNGKASVGFNLGGFVNYDAHNHLLFSIGHRGADDGPVTAYLGYQITV